MCGWFPIHITYMGYQEEGAVYELPWEYECSDDEVPVSYTHLTLPTT